MPNEAPIGAQFQLVFRPAFREQVPATNTAKPVCNRDVEPWVLVGAV
jgi:hypothetical protein